MFLQLGVLTKIPNASGLDFFSGSAEAARAKPWVTAVFALKALADSSSSRESLP